MEKFTSTYTLSFSILSLFEFHTHTHTHTHTKLPTRCSPAQKPRRRVYCLWRSLSVSTRPSHHAGTLYNASRSAHQ